MNPPSSRGVSSFNVLLPTIGAFWRGAVIVIGVAAGLPARAGDVRSHAHPAGTYGDAVARAERMIIERDSDVVAGDCSLANGGIRLETGREPMHPLSMVARAYGFEEEAQARKLRKDNA